MNVCYREENVYCEEHIRTVEHTVMPNIGRTPLSTKPIAQLVFADKGSAIGDSREKKR